MAAAAATAFRTHLNKESFTRLVTGGAYVSGCKDETALVKKELNRQASGPNPNAPNDSQDFYKVSSMRELTGHWRNLNSYMMARGGLLVFDASNTGSVCIVKKSPPEYTSIGAIPAGQGYYVFRGELLQWYPELDAATKPPPPQTTTSKPSSTSKQTTSAQTTTKPTTTKPPAVKPIASKLSSFFKKV